MTRPTRSSTPIFNFTRRSLTAAISKHPATTGQRYFRDAGTRGLVLELTPAGNASFQAYFKHLGRPVRVTLGRFDPLLPDARQLPESAAQNPLTFIAARPALSVTMARALAAAVRGAIAAGASPTRHAAALRADPTVGELLDEYVVHLEQSGKRKNSADSARAALAHVAPLRHTRAADLKRDEVTKLHQRVGKRFPTMANRAVLDNLRAAFNLALKNDRIAHRDNPATGIKRFPETQRERYLSEAELALLRRSLVNEREDFRELFELLVMTGARKSAALFMRHADVDLDRAEWRIPAEHSKSGKPYTVPLMPAGVAILTRRRAESSGVRVFAFSEATLDRCWHRTFAEMRRLKVLDALQIPATSEETIADLTAEAVRRRLPPTDYTLERCTIHDLRRTTGSHAAIAGISLHLIGALLGHTSQRATGVYARLSQYALREAATRASATLAPPPALALVVPLKHRRG